MTGPDPATDAADLARLDGQIPTLQANAAQAHQTWVTAHNAYRIAVDQRQAIAARLAAVSTAAPGSAAPGSTAPGSIAPGSTAPGSLAPPAGPAAPTTVPPAGAPVVAAPPAAPVPVGRAPETSTRTVQNVLFILGGLLLGTAAIAFTAVAWATFGVRGRAAILAVVTLVALGIPFLALARRLRATAETFAAIGLLLVVLDGYAAWYVNLAGVQTMPGSRYAGLVAIVTTAAGYGYRRATGLVGPAFAALLAAQPVLVLLFAQSGLGPAGFSLLASATGAATIAVAWRTGAAAESPRRLPSGARVALRALAGVAYLGWLSVAGLTAMIAESTNGEIPGLLRAGAATVVIGLLLLAGALVTGEAALVRIGAGALVVLVALAAVFLVPRVWTGHPLLAAAAVALGTGVLVLAVNRLVPVAIRPGPRAGALVVAGVTGSVAVVSAVFAAGWTISAAYPLWHATLVHSGPDPLALSIDLPASLVLLTVALLLNAPQWSRAGVAVAGGVLTVLAGPASLDLVWWSAPVLSLVAAALLLALFAWPGPGLGGVRGSAVAGAAVLTGDAVLASAGRPGLTAAILAGTMVLGLAAARMSTADDSRRLVGAGALLVGLVALPPAVGSALVAADVVPWWVARATVAATLLPLLTLPLLLRGSHAPRNAPETDFEGTPAASDAPETDFEGAGVAPGAPEKGRRVGVYAGAAYGAVLGSAVVWPAVAAVVEGPAVIGVYAGVSLALIAVALLVLRRPARVFAPAGGAAAPGGRGGAAAGGSAGMAAGVALAVVSAVPGLLTLGVVVLPAVFLVAAAPYSWLSAIWSARPVGVGLVPPDVANAVLSDAEAPVRMTDAVALALLAIACATGLYAMTGRVRTALGGLGLGGPTALLVALAAGHAQWPAVPAATLVLGLLLVAAAALGGLGGWRAVIGAGQGIVYIGAGIAGSLAAEWATLTALGAVLVVAVVVAAVGRTTSWRVAGVLTAVGFAVTEAAVAGAAADLRVRDSAFWVLGVAVATLFLGARLPGTVHKGQPDDDIHKGQLRRRAEAVAAEAAAHGAAVVALLFTVGWREYAAAVCALWGLAVGVRALLPGTRRPARASLAALAAGFELLAWWLLLLNREVTFVEAYTLPLAAVALLAGWAALKSRSDLTSWVAYGPALVAAFGPTLAVVIGTGDPWRRLALGAGALVVVVAGSRSRRRAPVVIGGIVLIVVALHELVVLYQRLPGWVALAAGGVVLVVLAVTYERRLRDLARLRSSLSRMT